MEAETRRLWLIVLAVGSAILGLLLFGQAEEELRPEPTQAWVAIEVGGTGMARVGSVDVEAGGDFTLHAVLEADSWQGDKVYYTEAESLEMPDGPVPPDSLRRWHSSNETRVHWFSVEAAKPFLEIRDGAQLDELEFREFFLADWPRTWAVSGRWGATSAGVTLPRGLKHLPFGTRRFHVRIDVYGRDSDILPLASYRSWGGAALRTRLQRFPTVHSRLSGALGPASHVFGLPQIEVAADGDPRADEAAAEWHRTGLAFSRLRVIKSSLDAAGMNPDALDWRAIELNGEEPWGAAGDLLRVGDRWVLIYQDVGVAGRLDYEDLCFDFDKGAAVRELGDIFVGEGLVERAGLGGV